MTSFALRLWAGVHVCCFVRLGAFRGIHPAKSAAEGWGPHLSPTYPSDAHLRPTLPGHRRANHPASGGSHSRREDPSPGATRTPRSPCNGHLGHHKASLRERWAPPGPTPQVHPGPYFLAHTLLCARPGRGTPSPLWAPQPTRGPSPGTTEAPSQLLHSHLGHRHKALLGVAPGDLPGPTPTRPPSRGGSSAHFFVDLHRLPFNAQPTASGQHGPNTWAPQPQARCPP